MIFLDILKLVSAVLTVLVGIYSLVRPRAIRGFTGLDVTGPRGVTEIRSVLGGAFIGLGLAPLILGSPYTFKALGIVYLAIALVRLGTMFIDKSIERSNILSLASEIVFGCILVI